MKLESNEHIEPTTLDLYLIAREKLTPDELRAIDQHLEHCRTCSRYAEKLTSFYDEIESRTDEEPSEADRALAKRIIGSENRARASLPSSSLSRYQGDAIDAYAEVIEPYPFTWRKRAVRYLQAHPVKVASTSSLAFAALALAFLVVKPMLKDTNPAYARAKDEFLIAYNKEGEELWRKHIGIGYDQEKPLNSFVKEHPERYFTTKDVDGDGRNETIAVFGWTPGTEPLVNSIFCYDPCGNERWRYEFHRKVTIGNQSFTDNYRLRYMMVGDFDADGRQDVVVVATHDPYYPTFIVRLDAKTGSLVSEYLHTGWILTLDHHDLDGDGVEELIFGGQNNSFGLASLLVLDPRLMNGTCPSIPGFAPGGMKPATEKYYALLPRTDLGEIDIRAQNQITGLSVTADKLIETYVSELTNVGTATVYYYFDTTLKCTKGSGTDPFTIVHRKLEAEGRLTKKLDDRYFEELRRGVRYWDGEKFVNEPTMNRLFSEARRNLP